MRIGVLASKVGVKPTTIRFYEAEGILPEPKRLASGYRDYAAEDVDRVRFVARARSLGLALDDIREILALRDRDEHPCRHVRGVIERELEVIDERIAGLRAVQAELNRLRAVADRLPPTDPSAPCVCHIIQASHLSN